MIERNNMREVVKWGGHLLSISRKASCIHCGNLPSYHSLLSFLICIRVSSCGHGDRHRCGGAPASIRVSTPITITCDICSPWSYLRGHPFIPVAGRKCTRVSIRFRTPLRSLALPLGNNNVSHIEMKSSTTPYCFALR